MRKWVDLGVNPRKGEAESLIKTAVQLGYSMIGMENPSKNPEIDTIHRVDLYPRSQNDLGKQLRKHRNEVEIIVVHCKNKSVSRQAGRDARVDYLRFPIAGDRKIQRLDRQQAGLMKDSGVGYEVCIRDLMVDDRFEFVKRIGIIRKSLEIALKKDIPVIASSGACDQYDLRNSHGIMGVLSLLGVDEEKAMDMISTTPMIRVELNKAKLGDSFIEPGVWLVDP